MSGRSGQRRRHRQENERLFKHLIKRHDDRMIPQCCCVEAENHITAVRSFANTNIKLFLCLDCGFRFTAESPQ